MTEVKKTEMQPNSVPGVQYDGSGDYILLKSSTEEDHAEVKEAIVRAAMSDEAQNKDPNGECENPAPFEERQLSPERPKHHDLQGQQGGQKGGSREPL